MPDLSVTIIGDDFVESKFKIASRNLPKTAGKILQIFATEEKSTLAKTPYPAERSGQTYVRTGTLAASWSAAKFGELAWRIVNTANQGGGIYSGYVVGKGTQPWFHSGRWWIAADETEKRIPKLVKKLGGEIVKDLE